KSILHVHSVPSLLPGTDIGRLGSVSFRRMLISHCSLITRSYLGPKYTARASLSKYRSRHRHHLDAKILMQAIEAPLAGHWPSGPVSYSHVAYKWSLQCSLDATMVLVYRFT